MTLAATTSMTAAADNRARAELRLLAAIAPLGRWGAALAERAGISAHDFREDDLRTIYCALLVAHEPRIQQSPADRQAVFVALVRAALTDLHLWREDDCRPFVAGMTWGPGPLTALVTAMSRRDAEAALPTLADVICAMDRGAAA